VSKTLDFVYNKDIQKEEHDEENGQAQEKELQKALNEKEKEFKNL
jgi:hypothetical protein